jgi:hypothetical protein
MAVFHGEHSGLQSDDTVMLDRGSQTNDFNPSPETLESLLGYSSSRFHNRKDCTNIYQKIEGNNTFWTSFPAPSSHTTRPHNQK